MPEREGPIAAVVLAAGTSSRIGRPKALLPLGGGTCLSRVVGACRAAGVDPIHVVVGHRGVSVGGVCSREGAVAVWNDRYPLGQVTSLQAGLRSLPEVVRAALLFPVDHAAVEPETLRALLQSYRSEKRGKTVFVPTCGGTVGRPYLVDRSVFADFATLPPETPGRQVVLGDPARIREVPVVDPAILTDLDTPDDYLALRRRWDSLSS